MTTQLPAHLQGRQIPRLADRAIAGIGSSLPPHISIQGNQFTLIDATGAEQGAGASLTACIIDVSDHNCKTYFGKKWKPDSKDAPICWSANGVAPSREAMEPQSPTCESCEWNVRGSAISEMSGAAIKACRDEKWLALLILQIPNMLFRLVLTPGSFKNWKAYLQPFLDDGTVDIADVLTTISFQPQVNGVLVFGTQGYIDVPVMEIANRAYAAKQTDILVGRNDVPRTAALAAPRQESLMSPLSVTPAPAAAAQFTQPAQPAGAPQANLSQPAPSAFPSNPQPEPQRRRRRTQAEMQAANTPPAQSSGGTPPLAPFRQAQPEALAPAPQLSPFGAPAGGTGPSFGIQGGVAPNPELMSALDSVFGKKP